MIKDEMEDKRTGRQTVRASLSESASQTAYPPQLQRGGRVVAKKVRPLKQVAHNFGAA